MIDEIETLAERLSFLGDKGAAYKAAVAIQGAEAPEAAAIMLRSAWNRKEAALRRQLEAERHGKVQATATGKTATSTAGTKPQRLPTNRAEFQGLNYMERLWIYHNTPEIYNRYTGRLTKKDIMAIKDPQDRQRAIGENLHLFICGEL